MWALALLSFCAGALAVACYPYPMARKIIKGIFTFMRVYYKLVWLVMYAVYIVWCVAYEYKTGRFGGEGYLMILIPFFAYLIESRKEEKRSGKSSGNTERE